VSQRLPGALRAFAVGLIGLVVLCGVAELLCRTVLPLNFDPYIYPLGRQRYPDLLRFQERFQHFHSVEFFRLPFSFEYLYPAPDAVVYKIFFLFTEHPVRAFLGFSCGSLVIAGVIVGWTMRGRGTARFSAYAFPSAVLLCSYPVWSVLKQANIEIVLWVLVTTGLLLFLSGRGYSAGACFGLAASMKIYPVAYLALLLVRRQYREMIFGIGVLGVSTVASLWLVCPSISVSWGAIEAGLQRFRFLYVLHKRPEIGTDHSLFALYKLALHPFPPPDRLGHSLSIYLLVVGAAFVALFFLRIRHLPTINQIFCLTVACVLFPPVSYEYTLLHLLAPLALLSLLTVDLERRGVSLPGVGSALACSAILLAPLPELIWRAQLIEGQVKAMVLVTLFGIALRWPMAAPEPVRAELS